MFNQALGMQIAYCNTCSAERNLQSKFQKLTRIEEMLRDIKPTQCNAMNWDINEHCKLGMSCPKIHGLENRCLALAKTLEGKIAAVSLLENNDVLFFQVQTMMCGDFPRIYNTMDRIKATRDK